MLLKTLYVSDLNGTLISFVIFFENIVVYCKYVDICG